MSETAQPFDARLERLLQRVALDPRSALLRVHRPPNRPPFRERRDPGRALPSDRGRASEELARVHREEAATLLRDTYLQLFSKGRQLELGRRRAGTRTTAARRPVPDSVLLRLRAELRGLVDCSAEDPARPTLERVLRSCESGIVHPIQLPAAALRLARSDYCRMLVADEHLVVGYLLSAERCYRAVLRRSSRREHRAWVHDRLGCIEMLRGESARSAKHFAGAVRLSDPWPSDLLSWLAMSIQAGDADQALRAAQQVDRFLGDHPDLVAGFLRARRSELERGVWQPSEASSGTSYRIDERLGEVSHEVALLFR